MTGDKNFMFEIINAILWGTFGVYFVNMYAMRFNPHLLFGGLALIYGYASQYILKYWTTKSAKTGNQVGLTRFLFWSK